MKTLLISILVLLALTINAQPPPQYIGANLAINGTEVVTGSATFMGGILMSNATTFNGVATAGQGLQQILATNRLTGQTASVPLTLLWTNNTGVTVCAQVDIIPRITTASTSGTFGVGIQTTNEATADVTLPLPSASTATLGRITIVPLIVCVANGKSITFSTGLTNTSGAATYSVDFIVKRED